MKDTLKQFLQFRDALLKEQETLKLRLGEIHSTLGFVTVGGSSTGFAPRSRGQKRSPISLKEAILKATELKPLTKQEILDAVLKLGYRFSTDNPFNSIGVILYGKNPKFINEGGRFCTR